MSVTRVAEQFAPVLTAGQLPAAVLAAAVGAGPGVPGRVLPHNSDPLHPVRGSVPWSCRSSRCSAGVWPRAGGSADTWDSSTAPPSPWPPGPGRPPAPARSQYTELSGSVGSRPGAAGRASPWPSAGGRPGGRRCSRPGNWRAVQYNPTQPSVHLYIGSVRLTVSRQTRQQVDWRACRSCSRAPAPSSPAL